MNDVFRNIKNYVPSLQSYATAVSRNAAAADELVQECLPRTLIKARSHLCGTELRALLFMILHNVHVNDVRRNGDSRQSAASEEMKNVMSLAAFQPSTVTQRALNHALVALPNLRHAILSNQDIDGKSIAGDPDNAQLLPEAAMSLIDARTQLADGPEGIPDTANLP